MGKSNHNSKTKLPPKTKRVCGYCEEVTTWKYNPLIKHSICENCGLRRIYLQNSNHISTKSYINVEGIIVEKENKEVCEE